MKTDIAISSWNALQSGQPSEFTTQDIGFHFPKQNTLEKKREENANPASSEVRQRKCLRKGRRGAENSKAIPINIANDKGTGKLRWNGGQFYRGWNILHLKQPKHYPLERWVCVTGPGRGRGAKGWRAREAEERVNGSAEIWKKEVGEEDDEGEREKVAGVYV